MKPKKIYSVVDVNDELPANKIDDNTDYFGVMNNEGKCLVSSAWLHSENNINAPLDEAVTHWLKEETELQYCFGKNSKEIDFIQTALNAYWNDAYENLQRKDLGDIERKNYEYQLENSRQLLNDLI